MSEEKIAFNPLRLLSILFLASSLLLLTSDSNQHFNAIVACIALLISVITLEFIVSRSMKGYFAVPIGLLIAISYLYIGVAGFQSNKNLSTSKLSGFRVKLPPEESINTLIIYILTSASLLIGYCCRSILMPKKPEYIKSAGRINYSEGKHRNNLQLIYSIYLIAFSNLVYAILYGINLLYNRSEYIPIQSNISNNFFLSLVNIANVIGFLALGWISTKVSHFHKFMVWITFAFSLLLYFSDGSRTFGLGVLIFFAGRVIERRSTLRILIFAISIPISTLFTNLVISFRSGAGHGLIGHVSQLQFFDFSSLANYLQFNLPASSFAITGYAGLIANPIPFKYFFIEINPLPGTLTGWYEIASSMRFNYYTPYTTLGELYNYSPALLMFFFIILGFLTANLMLFQSLSQRNETNLRNQLNVGSVLLFTLLATQYNLRSSMRILYLAILLNSFFYLRERNLSRVNGRINAT